MKKFATIILGLAGATMAFAQTNNVTSVVISAETGEPVSGASVVVTGTDIATTTDVNGKFSIDAPAEYQTLTVSHNNLQPAIVNILPDPIVMKKANGLASGWGVELGLTSTTMSFDGDNDGLDRRSGFTLGVTYDYPINAVPNLSVLGGLFYMPKGYEAGDQKWNANYLELQATAKYAYTLPILNNDLKAFALAGPYVAYGIGGKLESPDMFYDDMSFFDCAKRFDAGLVIGFGVEYKRYSLTFRWGIGMVNIYDSDKTKDVEMEYDYQEYGSNHYTWEEFQRIWEEEYRYTDFDETIKNRSFMLTLGYRF